ncbi:MAG TPA: UPF0182 family protein [Actinobacteria bacterium]|nr:UPF0182 family protein [Actinomycetota bacterium]
MMKIRYRIILAAITVGVFTLLSVFAPFYVDLQWFDEVGYTQVFLKRLFTGLGLGVVSGILFFVFVYLNLFITRRFAPHTWFVSEQPVLEQIRQFFRKAAGWVILGASLVIAIIAGLNAGGQYDTLLNFLNATPFGTKDAVFGIDIGFYVFKLPFYEFLFYWVAGLLVTTFLAVMVIYLFDGSVEIRPAGVRLLPHVKAHLSTLAALFLANMAFSYRLQMYDLLYSAKGVVSGAGYTDVHANLQVFWVLMAVAIISAVVVLFNIRSKGWVYPVTGVGMLMVTSLVAGSLYPAFVQNFRVKPNELKQETPYIKRSIKATQKAYGLDKVKRVKFDLDNKLTLDDINSSEATIENIRLWDWRPLLTTYRQIQEIRPYYVFNDVDIDRYVIDGKKRQILTSAREMDTDKLQEKARTWVNKHMVFTHGYGLTMNAVNEVSDEGLPEFLVKDLPPETDHKELKITQPRIYYGEVATETDYAIVNTENEEFDYPAEDKNITSHYKGKGGFNIGSALKKAALAYTYTDINIAISSAIQPDSRIMLHRNVLSRVKKIAPFITHDKDPYIVIDRGRLFWVIDGYTHTKNYPYSQAFNEDYNYIRNSVKTVVDAYNGKVDFYMADSKDPILKTFNKIYPNTFKPLAKMPKGLQEHLRYPEDMFSLQSEVYATYHMSNPQVFYNKEDKWDIPTEVYESKQQMVDPYYVILQLAQSKNDFQLIRPFTPIGKNNMISWMSINSEPDKYGQILLYQFSKKKLVYGPSQVEARIDQNPEISESFSLWSQQGSRVIRGNLLVIPVKNSLLFVEPIYLQSEQSQIPELKRVIAVFGSKVAMANTFDEALEAIFSGKVQTDEKLVDTTKKPKKETLADLVKKANSFYKKATAAQKEGDWSAYGQHIKELGSILEKLKK